MPRGDVISGEILSERSVRDTKKIRTSILETPKNNTGRVKDGNKAAQEEEEESGQELLRENQISIKPSFSETFMASLRVKAVNIYSLFTYESLHSLHFGISKLVKECKVSYLSSDRSPTGERRGEPLLYYERGYAEGSIWFSVLLELMGSCQKLVYTFWKWWIILDRTEYLQRLSYAGC